MQQQQQEQLDTTHHATVRSRESATLPAAAVAGRAPRWRRGCCCPGTGHLGSAQCKMLIVTKIKLKLTCILFFDNRPARTAA